MGSLSDEEKMFTDLVFPQKKFSDLIKILKIRSRFNIQESVNMIIFHFQRLIAGDNMSLSNCL